jgi:apolipoprotein N-acyltransferase
MKALRVPQPRPVKLAFLTPQALAGRVILAWGWARLAIAFGAGAFGALAMPPFGALPALAVALTTAVWLLDGAAAGGSRFGVLRSAAVVGWAWGFGYFVAGLWWLGAAFLVEADQFAWALPFGVLGLPAVLAFFPALGFALARALWSPGAGRLFALAFGLGTSEWLRGILFTGFPWNTLGMALGQNLWLMQAASIVGLYGLTVLAVLICAAPATLGGEGSARRRWSAPAAALAVLAVLAAFGAARVPAEPSPTVEGVRLRLMQPNLPQDAKFRPENRDAIMARYLDLSDRATSPRASGVADATHLIWPESAFPFLLHREPRALAQIAALLPPGTTLITGAARAEEALPGEAPRIYNAIHAVGADGTILGTYDKVHLVPFGEYFPHALDGALRALGLRQFVHVPGGFAAGRRRPLEVPGLPRVAPTVCYEAIFPGAVVGPGPRPGLILNVTNDAWFGDTPGPHQHLAQARLRAVEEGLPLVRAANTGISAVIDPFGRIVASLPLGTAGVLDAALPGALEPPWFARFGPIFVVLLIFACAAASNAARRRSW